MEKHRVLSGATGEEYENLKAGVKKNADMDQKPAPSRNASMNDAKRRKNDEFYTRIEDIEAEIISSGCYDGCFQDKVVLCNCNDLARGEFGRFFFENFNTLGLRCLFIVSYSDNAAVAVYDGYSIEYIPLIGSGDFRSEEGIKILQRADVVVTNPPFSLFRNYILMLIEYDKQFIIIGNENEMTCKEIFPLYMNSSVRYGSGRIKSFQTPDGIRKFGNVAWYTNIGLPKKQKSLSLTCHYWENVKKYPMYSNYDAISVGRVKDIPCDYYGPMGVPNSYLFNHDPERFEIIGTSAMLAGPVVSPDGKVRQHPGRFYIGDQRLYERVVIRRRV